MLILIKCFPLISVIDRKKVFDKKLSKSFFELISAINVFFVCYLVLVGLQNVCFCLEQEMIELLM
jgi:hypothetical protein